MLIDQNILIMSGKRTCTSPHGGHASRHLPRPPAADHDGHAT
jgi:hypothetical protein